MRELTVSEKIQANPELIPSLPDVVAKALQLIDQPGVSPDDFEGLLSQDPPLVATMLKIANSPIYGFAHEKETIRDAIIGIGLNGLRSILMGSTLNVTLRTGEKCRSTKIVFRSASAVPALMADT